MPTPDGFTPFTGVVAVDGPSGSGKSTVSRRLAAALHARYLDTGAMYRAVTLAVLRAEVDPSDAVGVLRVLADTKLDIGTDPAEPGINLNGEPVGREIRTERVTAAVSEVSAIPGVRSVLIAQQRELAADGGIVIEGRDITTVVAPDADVRVLLTASAAARAARRGSETGTSAAEQQRAMRRRDERDARTTSFLDAADHGVLVLDSTELGIDEVVDRLLREVHLRVYGPVRR
ncbi:(d)CMP kinase [Fodinicola acaciae]|uniref:(d)CMP kinase n=1 Tax=Fodinicola acaciae TaxID=2681555 RepID=UPI001FE420AD|nr:(d)CMP kinase [Fodinicola acaciae]